MQAASDKANFSSELAYTDPLTGLGNMNRFRDRLSRTVSSNLEDPVPFAIAVVDVDGFTAISNLFGKTAGEIILTQIALRLRAACPEDATLSRIDCDEFALILPHIYHEQAAADFTALLNDVMTAPFDIGERTARLSASIGVALYQNVDDTEEALLEKAYSALRSARHLGPGRYQVYSEKMAAAARQKAAIEQALRRAVSKGEIEPYFQPIVDLKTKRTVGFECLARWTDKELGFVPPNVFIPIAEERGIISSLARSLLERACEIAVQWPEHLFMSFNLSPSQLVDANTGLHILAILDRTGFDPRRLEVEITETGVMNDPVAVAKIIEDMRLSGIRVSLDDFGTGQSSLGRLRDIRFDKLKIDRAFVAELLSDRPSEHIVKAILAMCQGLEIDVVAEGIEDEQQADKLVEFGCAKGQGYFFGRPSDANTTLGYLRDAFNGASRVRNIA